MEVFCSVMDIVYEASVASIQCLQSRFLHQSDLFFMISNVFDPRYAFLFYAPLLFSLDWKIGKKIMWVAVIAEWINQMLKWTLHGERPYWWVHETQVYNRTGLATPYIQQFAMTCETGPGSPSGHAMVTAAVWYVIMDSYLQKFGKVTAQRSNFSVKLCWMIYILILATVSASRVFIAAHFPHQCFVGMTVGWLVALYLDKIDQKRLNFLNYCALTAGMLFSALSMYTFLHAIGVDPMWSVSRAIKWCAKPEYVHLDTTPFFSMMRYCGFMFGMGFGFNSPSFDRVSKQHFSFLMKIICAALSIGVCKMSERVSYIKGPMFYFYVQAFMLNAFLSFIMIAVVPRFVSDAFGRKQKGN